MGGMNEESFNNFLMNISQHLDAHEIHNLIFDGAPAHRRAEAKRERECQNVATLLAILKYSGASHQLFEGKHKSRLVES